LAEVVCAKYQIKNIVLSEILTSGSAADIGFRLKTFAAL